VAQISKPGAGFKIVEREIPEPGAGEVRIRVQACGVCHSDIFVKEGLWPGIQYPRVPGHEVAGIVDELGAEVTGWKRGQRVGVRWHGGQDNTCLECRRARFLYCRNPKVAGISYDGGYQQYMVAPVEALAIIPDTLSYTEAAPLLCAGVTIFNALRHGGASPVVLLRCKASAVWATLEFNLRTNLAARLLRLAEALKMWRSQRNSGRACTSIASP
jgi:D-arabinose 1-dehydrogenase-like Zn-dependent alcohol dehydrogenase